MDQRTFKILEATVQEFIETGEPVSSTQLYKSYDFGIRPAMIRFELEELASLGLLEHRYHSAGRIPSDKGYELFARHIISQPDKKPSSDDEAISTLFEKRAWSELLDLLSLKLGILGVACEEENVYKNGLENLVECLEWETADEIKAIIRDFAEIEEHVGDMERLLKETPEIFIGKKTAITKSKNLSVVGGSYTVDGNQVMIFAIGPKRMDYEKTVGIFKNLKRKSSAANQSTKNG